jgi:hypothetical protein
MKQSNTLRALSILFLAGFALARPSAAKFAYSGQPVPVERLIANVGKFVEKNPKDAQGHYTLGRIHSLAFVRGTEPPRVSGNVEDGSDLPGFAPYESLQEPRQNPKPPTEQDLAHLTASLRSYQAATELAPKKSLYWLGLGWMREQGMPYAKQAALPGRKGASTVSADTWREAALAAYRRAYALDLDSDLKSGHLGPGADSVISLEAAEGINRLLPAKNLAPAEVSELARVKKTVEQFKLKPRVVTPIIFPLERPAPLASLLSDAAFVMFDLAADTRGERWPWVNAQAGILVWDPARTGRITSGAQLFGTATWSMYWSDGYAPLAALDDNCDGWLTDQELNGLAVWNDRNGDAVSDSGEVKPLQSYGVKRVAARAESHSGGSPSHPRGMQRNDGSYLPTYDWMPTSLPALRVSR